MKKQILLFLCVMLGVCSRAQIAVLADTSQPKNWDNYSTSYIGDISDSVPFVVIAIPYNGVSDNFGNIGAPLDVYEQGSGVRFQSSLQTTGRKLYTFDSAAVEFFAVGIYPHNAADYQYRVLQNGKTEGAPWKTITQFSNFTLNTFGKGFAYLGGYRAGWGNCVTVEVRKKNADKPFADGLVCWLESKPEVAAIYTTKNLNEFFKVLQRSWDKTVASKIPLQNPEFAPGENTIIYYLAGEVFKKEAIEYQLLHDGKPYRNWAPNDYDNNFIWLKELPPGDYQLQIRYSRQRHHVSEYRFRIKPQWSQTTSFKFIGGSLTAASFAFVWVFFRNRRLHQKMESQQRRHERLNLELKSLYAQLNPHFVFNALSSIQGLVNKNDTEAANRYLAAFGQFLRSSLRNDEGEMAPLREELGRMKTYLSLEQLRFGFSFDVTVRDAGLLDVEFPFMLLQPLLENAVKHAMAVKGKDGKIELLAEKQGPDLFVCVSDNGEGFNEAQSKSGHGLRITRERIRLLNEAEPEKKITLHAETDAGKGSRLSLCFLNWLA